MGGKSTRWWCGVSLYAAVVQDARRMTTLPPIIHVVDDDASFRSALGELLSACGYGVALYNRPSSS